VRAARLLAIGRARRRLVTLLAAVAGLQACAEPPPLPAPDRVDLSRFMGDWYVIANIPTFIERGAHNAVERYELDADGTIATTFSFNAGGFDGPRKEYRPRGFVLDRESNAVWGMRFVWPILADYRIAYVAPDYTTTVIARSKRDYVWIMARTPQIEAAEYARLVGVVTLAGYDAAELAKVPQRW
jgi:apolipoprotein D and lipocalin family protein